MNNSPLIIPTTDTPASRLSWLLVGGHKLPAESFRECVVREVTEELGLSAVDEFLVAHDPLAQLSYIAFSKSAQEDTLYSMKL